MLDTLWSLRAACQGGCGWDCLRVNVMKAHHGAPHAPYNVAPVASTLVLRDVLNA